jgi:divalent metal cation (Fe/Co/Zn/Cd) transporter
MLVLMTTTSPRAVGDRRETLQRRIRWIVAATIGYNLVEAVVAIVAGTVASSAALIGFGLDSTIEVLSAAAVAWQFTRRDPERWEKGTLRVIAVAFFALAAYVTASSALALVARAEVEHSTVGIVITALSVVTMPFLSFAERRAGRELGSATAIADSKQTLLCTYLSAAVLIGLVTNSLLGWWWADAVAGLVIAAFAVREGIEAWRGDACATSVGMLLEDEHEHDHDHDHDHDTDAHEHQH